MHVALISDDADWIDLLRCERDRGKSVTEIAREVGMKRTSLSLLLSGKYPASLKKMSVKYAPIVFKRYSNQVACPHLQKGIGAAECESFATQPLSMSSPDKLRHWRACQRCEINPTQPKKEET
jgi:hypothetical protein